MTTPNPFTDQSRWTLQHCCPCPECRLERDRKFRALLQEILSEAELELAYQPWPDDLFTGENSPYTLSAAPMRFRRAGER
jgi:hypothetical protein